MEYLYLFTATGTLTPGMLSKVYSFLDWDGWSGERVVLRPDGTIPVARLYIENLSDQESARLFYVTNIFAFEGTGKKDRERWQCGAEFFGRDKSAPDVEIILLAEDIVRKLGMRNVKLQLSHAGLVKALLKEFKLSPAKEAKITDRILEGDWQALTGAKPINPEIERLMTALLDLKGRSSRFLRNVEASYPKASRDFKSSLEDFLSVATLLDSLGSRYEIDIAAMQGFEYYTGICFRFLTAGEKIGGGGRYDQLVPLMNGESIPACGFALHVDPMMKLIPWEKEQQGKSGILVRGKESTPVIVKACFAVAESLRDAGHIAEINFTGREKSGYRWVISVSAKGHSPYVLKDCSKKQQREVASVAEILKVVGEG